MATFTITFYCHDCASYNKHFRDKERFEEREYEHRTLKEAMDCANKGHWVEPQCRQDNEDE